MTFPAPESAPIPIARIPSVVVLGADAILAALPATPVQLAHACLHAGYHSVLPASWGDELIADATLKCLDRRGSTPAIQCSCPLVAHRLLAAGADLRPFLVSLVSPPIALARYLRSAYAPAKVRITYVGRCPSASDESIDARLTPEELLAMLADRHIGLEEQPRVFDSVIPPDRRRHKSQPGGLPTPESLFSEGGGRHLVELDGHDLSIELAQHLLAGKPQLIDAASSLGCVCSGARLDAETNGARARIAALEPPRSHGPVIDDRVPVELELSLPASPRNAIDILSLPISAPLSPALRAVPLDDARVESERSIESVNGVAPVAGSPPVEPDGLARPRPAQNPLRRNFSQSGRNNARPATAMPTARDADGRQLPRTYVSRLRAGRPAAPPAVAASTSGSEPVALGDELTASSRLATPADFLPNAGSPSSAAQFPALPRADRTLNPEHASNTALGPPPILPSHGMPTPSVTNGTSASPRPSSSEATRVFERAIDLAVTRQSDGRRERAAGAASVLETRPLRQLLMFALLIATIVLTSAALGVVVGRWLTQR
jgi:hypothetical protein